MLAMLPLGIVYFTLAVTLLTTAVACILAPVLLGFGAFDDWYISGHWIGPITINNFEVGQGLGGWWEYPFVFFFGIVLLFGSMHLMRWIGHFHAMFAKHLLVKSAQYA